MDPQRLQKIQEIFHAACERQLEGERAAFLRAACGSDGELWREVESLLAQRSNGSNPLEQPAMKAAAGLLSSATATRLAIGTRLGPYQIEGLLGAGGMGQVYLASDTRLGRKVAVKISAEQFNERFEREARACAALNHPHICTLHDVGPNFLVMELVEGETLAARLKKGALPLEQAIEYGAQIADALAAAHAREIVHRDLKPGNVMITKTGVKVLDFGLAKSHQDETITATRAVMGTPAYMAPEQREGKEADARTDIYALGLVLYEMATGKRSKQGEIESREQLPAQLAHVIERCLVPDPDDRWQTAKDVKKELQWAAAMPAVASLEAPRGGLAWKAAAALLAIAAAVLGGVLWRATRPVDHPLVRLDVYVGPEAVGGQAAAISPDGRRLVFLVRGADGKQRLATRLLDQSQAAVLPETDDAKDPFFSPDGRWVAFFATGRLKKIALQGGGPTTICDAPSPRGGSWGDDDYMVAALNNFVGLSRVSANGGAPQPLTQLRAGEATHRWPQVLPGGREVLFTASNNLDAFEDASVELLTVKSGKRETVERSAYFGRFLPTGGTVGHLVYLHQGALWGMPFDPARPAVAASGTPILEDVAGDATSGLGRVDYSRTGTFVYRSGKPTAGGWPVVWLDSSGKTEPLLSEPSHYYTPRLAPYGSRLALSENGGHGVDLFVFDWQRNTKTRLTFTARDNIYPVWAPDGKHIAFRTHTGAMGNIEWVRADGAAQPQRLLESAGTIEPYSFSPDGRRLAYEEFLSSSGSDIWILPLDLSDPDHPKPGKPEPFLRTPANERDPFFSPDGRWIAYRSDESGVGEVYVRPYPNPEGTSKWQVSTAGGKFPRWSRNGRELFYVNMQGRIMVTEYTANGDAFMAGRPRQWSDMRDVHLSELDELDLAMDGRRYVVLPRPVGPDEQGSSHNTFLLNFFDEVRRRVPQPR